MKYLKIYEEFFEGWEEISADDWYDSKMENQPFDETEYDTLVNFCIDNDKYKKGGKEYEIDYDYVNPNKMGYGFHSGGRAWRFTIIKYGKFIDNYERYTAEHTTLTLFKKGESKDSSSLYFLSCEDHSTSRWTYFECDRFQDLMYLIKKHLDL
jgi:hypothetical protein